MSHVIGNSVTAKNRSAMRYSFSIAACFLFCFFVNNEMTFAAGDTIKIMRELKRNAVASYNKGDIFSAIEYYDLYVRMNKDDMKSMYRLAMLYHSARNYGKARECFNAVINKASDKFIKVWYYHGIVSMNLEDYATARESFTVFRKKYRKKRDPDGLRRMASNYIESADWALSHPESNKSITIQHLDSVINGPHIEFSPFPVSENKILYGTYVRDSLHPERGIRQLYSATRESGLWKPQGLLEGPVNNPDYNTGNAVISADGQRMYFTRSRRNWQNREISEIYVSHYQDGHWQQPEKLPYPINIENYTSTQPALGKNLRTGNDILYFVSDRPGTKGGLDIWYTQKDRRSDVYREPRNPGRNINSPANECCPFYDLQTRTLYFSSAGKSGYGGFDIYSVTGSASRWTDAMNIGKPINTSYDDMFFTMTGSGREGFFTSNRPGSLSMDNGSCCDDIFQFYMHECTRVISYGIVYSSSNYDMVDELNEKYHLNLEYPEENERLPDIPVSLYQIGNEPGTEILMAQTKTNEEGKYTFSLETGKRYKIIVKNYGFFDKVITLSTEQSECDDTLIISETGINFLPEITVRFNVYYEHDKYRLTPEARTAIDTSLLPLIDLFPNAVIEIGSHTDSTGSDDYNIRLSQRRSESVVRYLENKGIPGTRLQAKGYGERMPIAPNSKPDGTDNPEGRQLNRRTELKIVGESNLFYDDE